MCLVYGSNGSSRGIVGYTDGDSGGDLIRRRSLTCYIFTLYGCTISWKATLQPPTWKNKALSTTEAEYMSLTEGLKEGMWLHDLIESLGLEAERPVIYCAFQAKRIVFGKESSFSWEIEAYGWNIKVNLIRDANERKAKKFTVEKIATALSSIGYVNYIVTCREVKALLGLGECSHSLKSFGTRIKGRGSSKEVSGCRRHEEYKWRRRALA